MSRIETCLINIQVSKRLELDKYDGRSVQQLYVFYCSVLESDIKHC